EPRNRRTPRYRESTNGSTPPSPQPTTPRPRYDPSVRRSRPPTWTPTRNEPRAILRNLLHLGGQVDYTTRAITITLDRPYSPRVARALHLLTEELNATPATMPADHRPL